MKMNRGVILMLMALLVVGVGAASFLHSDLARIFCGTGTAVLLLLIFLLWRAILKPLDVVENGLGLLRSQDFGSRLRKVGEIHADKIVDLFNRLVSELKNERLRLSEQGIFLNRLIEVSPMGVALFDFDGRLTMVNRAFMEMVGLSVKPESMVGRRLEEYDSEVMEYARNLKIGEIGTARFGDSGIYRISRLGFMESGFMRPFILVERLTEEVMKAERIAYGKVIRVISHEVNNTMGGVISLLEMMEETASDEESRRMLESGESRCRALSEFIRSYTEIVKLSEPHFIRVDINDEISEMLPFLRMMAGDNISLDVDFQTETMSVDVDPVMWQQAMVNIVKNSIESVKAKAETGNDYEGRIVLRTERDRAGNAVVEVLDNGVGLDADTSQKIFTPFFSTKSNGRGIGLTLVGEILGRHGCRYSLRTGSDGNTRFSIRFAD